MFVEKKLTFDDVVKICPLCGEKYLFAQELADHLYFEHEIRDKRKLKKLMNHALKRA